MGDRDAIFGLTMTLSLIPFVQNKVELGLLRSYNFTDDGFLLTVESIRSDYTKWGQELLLQFSFFAVRESYGCKVFIFVQTKPNRLIFGRK